MFSTVLASFRTGDDLVCVLMCLMSVLILSGFKKCSSSQQVKSPYLLFGLVCAVDVLMYKLGLILIGNKKLFLM